MSDDARGGAGAAEETRFDGELIRSESVAPWVVIAVVWTASAAVIGVTALAAPAAVFAADWGFGLMVCAVLMIAAWTTRTILRETL